MQRIRLPRLHTVITVVLVTTLWWAVSCARDQTRTPRPTTPTGGVTLEVELPHPGLVILRSPTFR